VQPLPHHYRVQASGAPEGPVPVIEGRLRLETNAPPEFDGPEGFWSPESMLVASVANCYVLSFRAVARASRLEWEALDVSVEGVLDRVEGVTRFVAFTVRPRLVLADAEKSTLARTVLDKAKRACLITNSLTAACELVPEVAVRGG